ncbi:MAG: hypothetical protein WBL95_09160 [Microcoleus sp.]
MALSKREFRRSAKMEKPNCSLSARNSPLPIDISQKEIVYRSLLSSNGIIVDFSFLTDRDNCDFLDTAKAESHGKRIADSWNDPMVGAVGLAW